MGKPNQRQRAAAFGVYLHTGPTASALPLLAAQTGRRFSLDAALDALVEAEEPEAQRLKTQAAARLMRCSPESETGQDPYFDTAWRRVLGSQAQAFEQERHRARSQPPEPGRGRRQDDHLILRELRQHAPIQIRKHVADVRFDPHTFVTTATVSAEVSRSVASFAVQTDPQNWSKVAPSSFVQSYRVATDDQQRPIMNEDGKYKAANPDEPGESWSGYLFEEVAFDWDEIEAAVFRNVLAIDFDVQPQSLDMHFSLYSSVSSQVGVRAFAGGLDVDSGYFTARPAGPGWTRIEGEKRVRFRSLTPDGSEYAEPFFTAQLLNLMAPALVGMFMDEFMFEGATFRPDV